MAKRRSSFLNTPWLVWPLVVLLAALNAAGLYLLVSSYRAEAAQTAQMEAERLIAASKPPEPKAPPPPAMIYPPPIADMLQSGTLIVISKPSQHMYVFNDGMLWAATPVSTGKRRHETPSGIFPILQKRKFHRSNIYSNAPMPFMQRLSWEGIALHAGRVPGYAASHGCVRLPHGFAQALFKLTNMKATTVVIGDMPLENDFDAQQYALTAQLPEMAALAPPEGPAVVKSPFFELAKVVAAQPGIALASVAPPVPPMSPAPPPLATPSAIQPMGGQTIQLTAAATPAEAEAYWARLRDKRPDISRFAKRVEAAEVNARRVYRLRISGTDAFGYCAKLKAEGVGCLVVS